LLAFIAPCLPLPSVCCQYTRDEQFHPEKNPQWRLITRSEYDRLGRRHLQDVFTGNAERQPPRRRSRRRDYDYRNNLVREEWDGNPLEGFAEKVTHNRLTEVIGQPRARNNQVAYIRIR